MSSYSLPSDGDGRIRQAKPEQTPVATKSVTKTWSREQYDSMQEKAHEMGYHLITPYRKNLVNIRVGVIKQGNDLRLDDPETKVKS